MVLVALAARAPGVAAAHSVHVRGTATSSTTSHCARRRDDPGGRAPDAQGRGSPDGTYDLAVPDRARMTPYITARGHHTIYLQTFTTSGEDLENVNFQTPTEDVYRALAALLKVPLDAAGDPKGARSSRPSARGTSATSASPASSATARTASRGRRRPRPRRCRLRSTSTSRSSRIRRRCARREDGGVIWTAVPTGSTDQRAPPDDAVRELRRDVPAGPDRQRQPAMGPARARAGEPRPGLGDVGASADRRRDAALAGRARAAGRARGSACAAPDRACPFTSRTLAAPPRAARSTSRPALGRSARRRCAPARRSPSRSRRTRIDGTSSAGRSARAGPAADDALRAAGRSLGRHLDRCAQLRERALDALGEHREIRRRHAVGVEAEDHLPGIADDRDADRCPANSGTSGSTSTSGAPKA